MLYFLNDYSEGAHEKVLQHLIDTNMEQLPGYGTDHYCEEAKEKIKKACGCEDAEVFLLTGGTQTNQIVCILCKLITILFIYFNICDRSRCYGWKCATLRKIIQSSHKRLY